MTENRQSGQQETRSHMEDRKQAEVRAVLEERGKRYGKFSAHSHISQALKNVMQQTPGWNRLKDYQKESLEMIMHKVARVLNGDPQYDDNWVDICGYSQLATDTLREETKNAH